MSSFVPLKFNEQYSSNLFLKLGSDSEFQKPDFEANPATTCEELIWTLFK